ncbi:MAG: sensor histidine kinase [Roseburia sp.]|nr:sensor histidine kinase [Roseburia sp.]
MLTNRLIDNVILMMLAAVMVFQETDMVEPVLALLISVIGAALGLYISDRRLAAALGAGFAVGCVLLPELIIFMPVMFYHMARHKFWWGIACGLPFLALLGDARPWKIALWIGLSCLGVILAERTGKAEQLTEEMIRVRDSSTELNLALREKNKSLMEKQDYEIYLATLKERNRIAREIHDNVGHMLSRSILQVGALCTVYKEEPLHGQMDSINETLNLAMNSIRESVHDLHDDSIDLKQAILEATGAMAEKYRIHVDYDMSAGVPRNVKYCFITTVKEAMSNVVKHSDADRVEIILREHPGFYQLSIEDNGTIQPASEGDGIGLSNMKERVEALQGTIRVGFEEGFRIFISIRKKSDME